MKRPMTSWRVKRGLKQEIRSQISRSAGVGLFRKLARAAGHFGGDAGHRLKLPPVRVESNPPPAPPFQGGEEEGGNPLRRSGL